MATISTAGCLTQGSDTPPRQLLFVKGTHRVCISENHRHFAPQFSGSSARPATRGRCRVPCFTSDQSRQLPDAVVTVHDLQNGCVQQSNRPPVYNPAAEDKVVQDRSGACTALISMSRTRMDCSETLRRIANVQAPAFCAVLHAQYCSRNPTEVTVSLAGYLLQR